MSITGNTKHVPINVRHLQLSYMRRAQRNIYVSEIGPEIRTGCTWDRFDGALRVVVRRNNYKKLPMLSGCTRDRGNQGTPLFYGFTVCCSEPKCITYEGRGYMSFLWRA